MAAPGKAKTTAAKATPPKARKAAVGRKTAGATSTRTSTADGDSAKDGTAPAPVVRPRNLISVLARKRLAGRHGVTPKGQRRQLNQAVKRLADDPDDE